MGPAQATVESPRLSSNAFTVASSKVIALSQIFVRVGYKLATVL